MNHLSSNMSKSSEEVNFNFLFLIKEKAGVTSKNYDRISEEARKIIISAFQDFKPVSGNIDDHESWYKLEGELCGYNTFIKHFKMRVIWEIKGKAEGNDLVLIRK